ncbi:MAG: FAD-dependent oxidoreductase [Planctomycetes bacterium]|nr:FAD-dependent oxidoreductase [Planctomycetota bacterium]
MKIAILGAGISGVSLARMLAADGHDVVVLEKSERAGGLCKSRQVDGFTFDDAGGHIMFSKRQDVLQWMKDRCGGDRHLVRTERQTKIRWHDRWVPYPFENGVGHLTKEAIVDCMEGYIDAHVQRRLGAPCPENFGDWIEWRMGGGFARHFMVPYNEKIWKCDLRRMSSAWVAGRVPEAPIRDVLSSAVGLDTQGYAHQSVFWFPEHGGFETMVVGTVRDGGFELRCNAPVENVRRDGDAFRVNGERYDLVVNTVPLPLVEPAFEDIPDEIRGDIRELVPISLVNVLIGVKLDEPMPPLSWIYLPFPEQGPANRVTYYSNYSPHNAPAGHGCYMAEVTHRGELRADRAFARDVCRALDAAGILDADRVVTIDHVDSRFAYIDQDLGFDARIGRVRGWFDTSGYITFGRFGRYEYHNSDQCIGRAMEVREHVRDIADTGRPARPRFA